MSLKINEFTDSEENWNHFIKKNAMDGGLLQSWKWSQVKGIDNESLKRFVVTDESGAVKLQCQAWLQRWSRLWNIIYIPRGPVFSDDLLQNESLKEDALSLLWEKCSQWAKRKKAIFLRIDWPYSKRVVSVDVLNNNGFIESPRLIQPKQTLVLKLNNGADNILAEMKSKTRYNIRLAIKKGVRVTQGKDNEHLNAFANLLKKTENRHKINQYSKEYYENLLNAYSVGEATIWRAQYQGIDIAANLNIRFGNTEYYLYGASDYNYRNIMGTYLLQWRAIERAVEDGLEFYDFWGIASGDDISVREQKWAGFTKFKKGFAPKIVGSLYLGTWEKVYRERMYKLLKWFR